MGNRMFDLGLRDKVAVITGGSDGLGLATAERLATEGAKVVICARREDHLMRAAEGIINRTGAEVLAVRADVSVAADIEQLIDSAVRQYGGVDILVNNAGKSAAAGLEDVTDEEWQDDDHHRVVHRCWPVDCEGQGQAAGVGVICVDCFRTLSHTVTQW